MEGRFWGGEGEGEMSGWGNRLDGVSGWVGPAGRGGSVETRMVG